VGLAGLFTSVGLVPCTGAMILLLFTLANGLLLVGLLATVAIGVGMATTLSALGLLAILLRRGLSQGRPRPGLQRMVAVAAALVVTLVGAAMLVGTLQQFG
jgi:ABC-type nickel/cobalt efflux system permease component RcnA